jgi:hypothetical protein
VSRLHSRITEESAVSRSNETGPPGALSAHQTAPRFNIDWRGIEMDYVAGKLSLREMARKHGCSHSAIANHAGRCGWSRSDVTSDGVLPLLNAYSHAAGH